MENVKKRQPYKQREFKLFCKWFVYRALGKHINLENEDALPPEDIELLNIPHQNAFAEKFELRANTLSDWKEREEFREEIEKLSKSHMVHRTPEVIDAFLNALIAKGDAARMQLFLQYFHLFSPSSAVKVDDNTETGKKLQTVLKNLYPSDEPKTTSTKDNSGNVQQ